MKTATKKENTEEINPKYLSNDLYLDLFLYWVSLNPELFNEKYPELSRELTEGLNSIPEITAALIEKLPSLFPIWLTKANEFIGTPRVKELKNIASILENIINKELNHDIIEHSRKKMINIAKEYLDIINSLLAPQEQPRKLIGFKSNDEHY